MAAIFVLDAETNRSLRRSRIFRDRTKQLDVLSDSELRSRYRLPRYALINILESVRACLERPTKRSQPLSPETQVLICLRYLAKGGFLTEIGDLHGVSIASVSTTLKVTLDALCAKLPQIAFPTSANDIMETQLQFFKLAGFPKVIGAIDGTIIPIKRPNENEAAFVCRKGFHGLNIQAVCDPNLRFTNVVARWPGSTHDSCILTNSLLGEYFGTNTTDGWLLGDSGYPCKTWLLTPFNDTRNRSEEKYNISHVKTRNTIERAFGILKSRFRCLHKSTGCLQFQPNKCCQVVKAAFLLHNLCRNLNVPDPEPLDQDEDMGEAFHVHVTADTEDGYEVRRMLTNNVFG